MQGMYFTDTPLTGVEDQKTNKDQTTKSDIKTANKHHKTNNGGEPNPEKNVVKNA